MPSPNCLDSSLTEHLSLLVLSTLHQCIVSLSKNYKSCLLWPLPRPIFVGPSCALTKIWRVFFLLLICLVLFLSLVQAQDLEGVYIPIKCYLHHGVGFFPSSLTLFTSMAEKLCRAYRVSRVPRVQFQAPVQRAGTMCGLPLWEVMNSWGSA